MQHLDDVSRDIPKRFAAQYGDLLRGKPFEFDMYFNNFLFSIAWDVFPAPSPEQAEAVIVKSFEETVLSAYPPSSIGPISLPDGSQTMLANKLSLPMGSRKKLTKNLCQCLSGERVLIQRFKRDHEETDAIQQERANRRQRVIDPRLQERNWTIDDWRQNAGVNWHTANNYYIGKTTPRKHWAAKLVSALGLSHLPH